MAFTTEHTQLKFATQTAAGSSAAHDLPQSHSESNTMQNEKAGPGVGLHGGTDPIYVSIGSSPGATGIGYMLKQVDSWFSKSEEVEPLNPSPPYQRGYVWTWGQSAEFMGFLISGGRVPAIYTRLCAKHTELIDGKQRLRAVQRFLAGDLPARTPNHGDVWWSQFSVVERRRFRRLTFPVIRLDEGTSDETVFRLYLQINSGGTSHTKEELTRVRAMLNEEEATCPLSTKAQ